MQNITSVDGLKNAIQLLETEQKNKGELLKKQVMITYESLKPVNLIKKTLEDLFSSSFEGENISGIAAGLTGGFLFQKLFVGRSGNLLKKLIGSILQFGITNIIAQNSNLIRTFVPAFIKLISGKKKQV
jgi:hypothetical protein